MKNPLVFVSLFTFLAIASCGPSEEEKVAAEKKSQDSIAAAKVQMQAAMEAARQQRVEDSIAVADSSITTVH